MTKTLSSKVNSPILKFLILLIKIPLLVLAAGSKTSSHEEEPNVTEDIYMQNPSLFDPRPPKN